MRKQSQVEPGRDIRKNFCHGEGGQELEEVAHASGGVPVPGDKYLRYDHDSKGHG